MASLQSSFTVLATTPNPRGRTSPFLKPSRARVSCNGGDSGGGRVDRRNMLLGLGGLYGASSLVSSRKAEAKPLQPPNLGICDHEGTTTTERGTGKVIRIDADCCPPYTGTDPDKFYVPPAFYELRRRPAAHRMTPEYLAKYKKAIQMMKDLDTTDPDDPRGFAQQANIHCAYCNGPYDQRGFPTLDIQVHNSWIFFPFHRWYLYFFERICGELIGDDTFALPYWNWDHPNGMYMPSPFTEAYSPLYDCNRDQTHWGDAIVDLDIGRSGANIKANLNKMQQEMIVQSDSALAFMGQPYRAGDPPPGTATGGTSERGSHTGIHVWTGNPRNPLNENMGNFYSAGRDPIFYCHHANVDRMWTIWNFLHPLETIDETDFLDAAFLFYDEKKNLVKVRVGDCLDYRAMGYEYEFSDISPWLNYITPQRLVPAKVKELAKTAKTAAEVFPFTLAETIRVVVPKPSKGKADEVLLIKDITVKDSSKLIIFEVLVNDDENSKDDPTRVERAGGFTQIPHSSRTSETSSNLRLILTKLYKDINIADDDDEVVVSIVPVSNGEAVSIGGIKIVSRVPVRST